MGGSSPKTRQQPSGGPYHSSHGQTQFSPYSSSSAAPSAKRLSAQVVVNNNSSSSNASLFQYRQGQRHALATGSANVVNVATRQSSGNTPQGRLSGSSPLTQQVVAPSVRRSASKVSPKDEAEPSHPSTHNFGPPRVVTKNGGAKGGGNNKKNPSASADTRSHHVWDEKTIVTPASRDDEHSAMAMMDEMPVEALIPPGEPDLFKEQFGGGLLGKIGVGGLVGGIAPLERNILKGSALGVDVEEFSNLLGQNLTTQFASQTQVGTNLGMPNLQRPAGGGLSGGMPALNLSGGTGSQGRLFGLGLNPLGGSVPNSARGPPSDTQQYSDFLWIKRTINVQYNASKV